MSAPIAQGEPPAADAIPLLWHANAPWVGTGYGTQTALFGPRMQERLGYRVAFSAFFGLQGSKLGWTSDAGVTYPVYPANRDAYGIDVLGAHYAVWAKKQKGIVVTLTDPWVLAPEVIAQLPCLAWTPVDHAPLMPRTASWCFRSGAIPLAMSRFGQQMFQDGGLDSFYAPHGFDPEIFQVGNRQAARALLGVPQDAFVVGMVAANKGRTSRKSYPEALDAFATFKETVCPDAVLYLHTQLQPPDGLNLHNLCETLKIYPHSADQYKNAVGQPAIHVAALLNCFDVLLNPAAGEGFGVPLAESQACGTPCITTDFSAMPEVAPVAKGNWAVEGQRKWTDFESWQMTPNVAAIVQALTEAYEEPGAERIKRRKRVATWAKAEYAVDHVVDTYWKPVLRDALDRITFENKRMRTVGGGG